MNNIDSGDFQYSEDRSDTEKDAELIRSVIHGSTGAWRKFLSDYAGLIYTVTRRHLPTENEETIQSVYVDILKKLYDGDLLKFHGRSALSTWLFVYAGRKALDFWRAQHGRYRQPKGLHHLNELDQEVLRLYYVERMSLEIVIHTLNWNGYNITANHIVESIQRIENKLDPRFLKRLDDEYSAKKNGADSIHVLKYIVHARVEFEKQINDNEPEQALIEKEAQHTAEQVRALISKLPKEEQRIIHLRFNQGLPAKEISKKLGLSGQRKVYTIIDRVIRKLKVSMGA